MHAYYQMGDVPKIPVIRLEDKQDWSKTNGPFHCDAATGLLEVM